MAIQDSCRSSGAMSTRMKKLGRTSRRLMNHTMTTSTRPPKYPAVDPTIAARMLAQGPAMIPMSSDFCSPTTVWA